VLALVLVELVLVPVELVPVVELPVVVLDPVFELELQVLVVLPEFVEPVDDEEPVVEDCTAALTVLGELSVN
jgi:hypothetical protein